MDFRWISHESLQSFLAFFAVFVAFCSIGQEDASEIRRPRPRCSLELANLRICYKIDQMRNGSIHT